MISMRNLGDAHAQLCRNDCTHGTENATRIHTVKNSPRDFLTQAISHPTQYLGFKALVSYQVIEYWAKSLGKPEKAAILGKIPSSYTKKLRCNIRCADFELIL